MKKPLFAILLSATFSSAFADSPLGGTAATSISQPVNRELADFQHGSVVANGVRLHYVVAGKGEPVVLVPGWPESWSAWRHVMPSLVRSGRRVYAIDPRGFGDSEKPLGSYDPAIWAKDLQALIQALELSKSPGIDVPAQGQALSDHPPAVLASLTNG